MQKPETADTARPRAGLLRLVALAAALLATLPLAAVVARVGEPGSGAAWAHLASTVLPDYLRSTLLLCAGVGAGTLLAGTLVAWLVAMHRFPGRDLLAWALVLPLAMPAWVVAYVYTDWLQFSGPVQSWLRELTGWGYGDYRFPAIRSLGGAVLVFVLVLYPYVYLLARDAFEEASGTLHDAARSLGCGYGAVLRRVALPLARPALVAGMALALMETVADFGAVSYFGVQTFTTGIYRAWYSLGDPVASAQLSALLLAGVLALLVLERRSRGRARYAARARAAAARMPLSGWRAWLALAACLLPVAGGFLLPAWLLLQLALSETDLFNATRYLELARNSGVLAVLVALCAVVVAVLVAYATRAGGRMLGAAGAAAGVGYAVPGTVLAVGVLTLATLADQAQSAWRGDAAPWFLFSGSLAVVVYALVVRFLALAQGSVEAGLARIPPSMDDAARSLGSTRWAALRRVHLPLLSGSVLTALLLVFVETMKELPATLMLRPFGYDTLATQAWLYAADERLAEAAWPSLAIVLAGLVPVLVLTRRQR